jgi:hypothetical protein
LQAGLDYTAGLKGGTVEIKAGEYLMYHWEQRNPAGGGGNSKKKPDKRSDLQKQYYS